MIAAQKEEIIWIFYLEKTINMKVIFTFLHRLEQESEPC